MDSIQMEFPPLLFWPDGRTNSFYDDPAGDEKVEAGGYEQGFLFDNPE